MERRTIFLFGIGAAIASMCWMGYKGDAIGIIIAIAVGVATVFLANKIELRRK